MGQRGVNTKTRLEDRQGGAGHTEGGRPEGGTVSHSGECTGTPQGGGAPVTAGGGGGPPLVAPQNGFVRTIGGVDPSTEEGADLY